jgi:hypothetical protein
METSKDRTRRRLLEEVNRSYYRYQTRILFLDIEDYMQEIVDIFPNVRAKVSRKFKYKTLWYLRVHVNRPYIQFFTNEKPPVEKIESYLSSSLKLDIQSVDSQPFTSEMKEKWTNTVKRQKLAGFDHLKTKQGQVIRRWSVTGKNLTAGKS